MPLKFGYWDIRGLMAPIEMLCEHLDQKYSTERYLVTKDADGKLNGMSWFGVKEKLGLPFPNIPWMQDEETGVKMSETTAIMKYLSRKTNNAVPKNISEWALADQLENVLMDFRMGFIKVCYPGYGGVEETWFGTGRGSADSFLQRFEKVLDGKDWFCSDEATYIDFYAWEIIDHHCCRKPSFLKNYPNLTAWKARFSELEGVKRYHSRDSYKEYPINASMAMWGGKTENDGILE